MNETMSKLLLAENKVMNETHLRQPEFTDSACKPFTKNNENKKFKET